MNPAMIIQLMQLKKRFDTDHPMFSRFLNDLIKGGVPEGSIIEISITRPDGTPVTTNMKVTPHDIEMINALKKSAFSGPEGN